MKKTENVLKDIAPLLKKTFVLLKRTQPVPDEFDTVWEGPYFISRPKNWHPTRFLLYKDHLYCSVTVRWRTYNMTWKIGSHSVEFERGMQSGGDYYNNEFFWSRVLLQVVEKLKRAVQNPDRYNRHVERLLPLACRAGKVKRHLTWEKGVTGIIPIARITRLEKILSTSESLPKLEHMTLNRYLGVVAVAKDAVFKDLRGLDVVEKYNRHGDGRHGGLLELSPDDSIAFADWYHSGRSIGSHPWEIVFGNPHGIMLAPFCEDDGWSYRLWVDSLGWYKEAALMAIAMGEKDVPFTFVRREEFVKTLRGEDMVDVGPFYGMISYDDMVERRPDSIKHTQWDPVHRITKAEEIRRGMKGSSKQAEYCIQ